MQLNPYGLLVSSMITLALLRWPAAEVRKRGKVLREPGKSAGLLIVEGQQYPFSVNEIWKSEAAPKTGMVVEVEFSRDGSLTAVRTVSDATSRRA